MSSNNTTLSKTITFLRFPLIVAVVFIHTGLREEGEFPIYDMLYHAISDELSGIVVPLFFFISGFLFFFHSDFSKQTYIHKLRKRIYTLLIPYLFWNLIPFIINLSNLLSSESLMSDIWIELRHNFWGCYGNYPLWFLRNLIIVTLFTPILYCFIKHSKASGIVFLGAIWIFSEYFDTTIFGLSKTLFFFSFGAWFSINQRDFTAMFFPIRWASAFTYVVLAASSTWLWHCKITDCSYIHNISFIVGLVAIIGWVTYAIEKGIFHTNIFLAGSSFLIYAYHGIFIGYIMKCWMAVLPINEYTIVTGYFFIPLLTTAIGISIYAFLRKYFSAFTAFITGGR